MRAKVLQSVLKDVKIWSFVRKNNFLFPKKEDRIAITEDSIADTVASISAPPGSIATTEDSSAATGDSIPTTEDHIVVTEDLFLLMEDNLAAAGTVLATSLNHIYTRGMPAEVNLLLFSLQHRPAE